MMESPTIKKVKTEKGTDFIRSKELIIVTIIFPIFYLAFCFYFLQALSTKGLLFPSTNCAVSLFFSQDIFDMFWLIFAAIPNGIFSYYLYRDLFSTYKKARLPLICVHIGIIVILSLCVVIFTGGFNKNPAVWSRHLSYPTGLIYSILEFVSAFILSSELAIITLGLPCIIHYDYPHSEPNLHLSYRIFVSSIILSLYWFMLILSGIANDFRLGGRVNDPGILPTPYFIAGLGIATLSILSFHIFWHDPARKKVEISKIVISGIIPFIAIALQLFQIFEGNN